MTSPPSPFRRPAGNCPQCVSLRGKNREYFRSVDREPVAVVRTWCRVCGQSALVGMPLTYAMAVRSAHWLDDQVMDHEEHTEAGGWGYHWRLDAVLRAIFPGLHLEDLFPLPGWYPHRTAPEIELEVVRVFKKNGVDRIL